MGRDELGAWDSQMQTIMYRMNRQQVPAIYTGNYIKYPGINHNGKECEKYVYVQWHPTPVLLPGKSHGRRSLVGCSPRGCWESDTTERLHFHFSLSCIGEGNGNPLQCSCLENPRDGGAWWAAIYGVAQSRTRLKWLRVAAACTYLWKS